MDKAKQGDAAPWGEPSLPLALAHDRAGKCELFCAGDSER